MKIAISRLRTPGDNGWDVSIVGDDPAQPCARFRLRRTPNGFPLPASPSDGKADWANEPHEELCTDESGKKVQQCYKDIMAAEAESANVKKFGRYLLSVLSGGRGLAVLPAAAARLRPGQPFAVELAFELGDAELHRIPWELAYGPTGPLAQRDVPVAFFRTVPGGSTTNSALELPLRVLFVVGNPQDQRIRPGSECLGLLQRLRMPALAAAGAAGAAQSQGAGLQVRVLVEATRAALATEVDDFRPQVVHFICHGLWTATGSQIKLRQAKASGVPGEMEDDPLDAASLLPLLKGRLGATAPPLVVVLNACNTGTPDEPREGYMAFAAELVASANGPRAAVGMAGEVADAACREFTQAAYLAMVAGEPIATATARARRAAMIQYGNFLSDVEWARPVLYMSQGAQPRFEVNTSRQALVIAASRYRKTDQREVLCDRLDTMSVYQSFQREAMARNGPVALAFADSGEAGVGRRPKLGKTRLLQEIACRAVFDGFVPCMIEYVADKPVDRPANLLKFALELARGMDDVRELFDREMRFESEAFRLAFEVSNMPTAFHPDDPDGYLRRMNEVEISVQKANGLIGPGEVDLRRVRRAMEVDLGRLLDDVRTAVPEVRAVLVMVDNLHLLNDLSEVLIQAVNFNGLGSKTAFAPLVVSYLTRGAAGEKIEKAIKGKSALIKSKLLDKFQQPVESRLAYTQYLLSLDPPCMVNARSDKRQEVEGFFGLMQDIVEGIPSLFGSDNLVWVIKTSLVSGMLKRAGLEGQFQAGPRGGA